MMFSFFYLPLGFGIKPGGARLMAIKGLFPGEMT